MRSLLPAAILCLGFAIGACYPAVAHPTRVGSGFSVVTTLGAHVVEDESILPSNDATGRSLLPTFGISAVLSVRDTSANDEGIGLRLSVGTGFAMPIWQAYVELPRDRFGPYDAGVGVALHGARPRLVMPYAQFGRQVGERRFWYTQQGVALGTPSSGRSGPLWLPTVALASGFSGGEATAFVTGIIGGSPRLHRDLCTRCSESREVTRNLVLVGVSWGQIVVSNLPLPPRDR